MAKAHRDDVAGTESHSLPHTVYLLPGKVVQWFIYMNPSGSYAKVSKSTRAARSPVMTYVFASIFWLFAGFVAALFLYPPSRMALMDAFKSAGSSK